ncbi:MAG: hypothetical protein LBT56_04045 [Prevotellaceae bacterium]|jgi:hypothetical protein|nr:hypothetical protein [Prevotellaceae bacterium]
MLKYYKIRTDPNSPCGVVTMDSEQKLFLSESMVNFLKGRLTAKPVPNPLKFTGSVYKPYPERPSHILEGAEVILVSEAFVSVLRGAGVDNFELFPTIVEYPKLKKTYTDYYVLNVVGTVDVLNKEKSEITTLMEGIPGETPGVHTIDKIVLDAKKLSKGDYKMFRPIQDPLKLIIDELVLFAFLKNRPPEIKEEIKNGKKAAAWGIEFDEISVE